MKKPTERMRKLHRVRSQRPLKQRRRLSRTPSEREANRRARFEYVEYYNRNGHQRTRVLSGEKLILPERMCLTENPNECAQTLTKLREICLGKGNPWMKKLRTRELTIHSYTDFSRLSKIDLGAMVVLLAELDRANVMKGFDERGLVNLHDWNESILEELASVGFFGLCRVHPNALPKISASPDRMIIPFVAGDDGEAMVEIAQKVGELVDFAAFGSPDFFAASLFTTCLSEAVSNVTDHAYNEQRYGGDAYQFLYPNINRFWFAATADRSTGLVRVVLYDQGYTVPVTYSRADVQDRLRAFLAKIGIVEPHDGDKIHAAVQLGASRTDEKHRGNGLPMMRKAIKDCDNGHFMVASRAGLVTYRPGTKAVITELNNSIGGTLLSLELDVRRTKTTALAA